MRRFLGLLVGVYLLLAVGNRIAEAFGARRCHCPDSCWCKRPVLSLFRWVFPWHAEQPEHDGHDEPEDAGPRSQRLSGTAAAALTMARAGLNIALWR